MPQRVLALELGEHELKGVVLETSFRDYRITGLYQQAIEGDDSVAEQLRRFVARPELQATTVLSSLPGALVTWRTFFVPFRDRRRLEQTVPFELEAEVPFGLDEVVVDYHALHRDKNGTIVMAALVQREDLEKHLALLAEAGLDPKVVDLAPLATLNILTLAEKNLPPSFAYVGGSLDNLVVALYRDGRLAGLRTVMVGLPAPHDNHDGSVSGNGKPAGEADWVKAVAAEIRWTLMVLNGGPPERGMPCYFVGDGVQFDDIAQTVSAVLELTARRVEPRDPARLPQNFKRDLGSFAAPLGLALREVAPSDSLGLNFRRGEFAYHRAQEEVRRALWRSGALFAVIVCLIIANTYMDYQRLQTRAHVIDEGVRNVVAETLPEARRAADPVRMLRDAIEAEKKKMSVLGEVAPPDGATVIDAMRAVASALPAGIKLDVEEFIMDPGSIRMKAETDSFETADDIKQKIAATGYFADVQVKDVKQSKDGQSVNFRLLLSFGLTAAPPVPK
jgi:Tfp pilus assembly PilM family ATPase